ncbi:MAG: AbrB/MazE/SpoVT family DNA-binding domain-containing protein, partial [Candidatus Bathyarchaeia archaeon]
ELREPLGIKPGDEPHISKDGDRLIIYALRRMKNQTDALYGSIKGELDAVAAVRSLRESGGRAIDMRRYKRLAICDHRPPDLRRRMQRVY